MTVKEYKEWLAGRNKTFFDLGRLYDKDHLHNMGKAVAFKECYEKCPDSFETDAEKTNREAESKVQSMTDKMENLKKQLKESKERADNGWERVRYLERKLKDVESLNDQLLRELARRQCKEEMGE